MKLVGRNSVARILVLLSLMLALSTGMAMPSFAVSAPAQMASAAADKLDLNTAPKDQLKASATPTHRKLSMAVRTGRSSISCTRRLFPRQPTTRSRIWSSPNSRSQLRRLRNRRETGLESGKTIAGQPRPTCALLMIAFPLPVEDNQAIFRSPSGSC